MKFAGPGTDLEFALSAVDPPLLPAPVCARTWKSYPTPGTNPDTVYLVSSARPFVPESGTSVHDPAPVFG